jgi:hypothetical protein
MNINISNNELNCEFIKLKFSDWLNIAEPVFFNILIDHEENNWLFINGSTFLPDYAAQVMLLRVDKALYKLDGKYKKQLWLSNQTAAPEFLVAQVFEIQESHFTELNNQALDHLRSLMSPQDIVKLTYDELGIVLTSERLKHGGISDPINILIKEIRREIRSVPKRQKARLINEVIDTRKVVDIFREELIQIDKLDANPDIFVSGILAGALIMLALHKNNKKVYDFLIRLNEQRGQTKNDAFDPIMLTLKAINKYKNSGTNKNRFTLYLCQIIVQAIFAWIEGDESPNYWRIRVSSGVDLMPYMKTIREIKEIGEAKNF